MAKRYEDYFKNKRKELSKNLNQCLKPIRNKNEVSFEKLDLLDIKGLNPKQSHEKIVVDSQTPNGRKRKLTFKIKPNSVKNDFLRHSEYLPRLIDQKLIQSEQKTFSELNFSSLIVMKNCLPARTPPI